MAKKNKYAVPGEVNERNQLVVEKDDTFIANTSAHTYRLRCLKTKNRRGCRHEYGANGCDVKFRKCPKCSGGAKGLPKRA